MSSAGRAGPGGWSRHATCAAGGEDGGCAGASRLRRPETRGIGSDRADERPVGGTLARVHAGGPAPGPGQGR